MQKSLVIYNARSNGLGNRVRATLGARNLARLTGRKLFVVWPRGKAFEPAFSDLWQGRVGTPLPLLASRALAVRYPFRDGRLTDIRDDDSCRVWQVRTGAVLELPDGARD